MEFEKFFAQNLASLDKMDILEFCKNFYGDRAKKACIMLENIPEDLKSFLRDVQMLVSEIAFQDGSPVDYPVKNLFLRFMIGPRLQGSRGLFNSLFYSSSFVKASENSLIDGLHELINTTFSKVSLTIIFLNLDSRSKR